MLFRDVVDVVALEYPVQLERVLDGVLRPCRPFQQRPSQAQHRLHHSLRLGVERPQQLPQQGQAAPGTRHFVTHQHRPVCLARRFPLGPALHVERVVNPADALHVVRVLPCGVAQEVGQHCRREGGRQIHGVAAHMVAADGVAQHASASRYGCLVQLPCHGHAIGIHCTGTNRHVEFGIQRQVARRCGESLHVQPCF